MKRLAAVALTLFLFATPVLAGHDWEHTQTIDAAAIADLDELAGIWSDSVTAGDPILRADRMHDLQTAVQDYIDELDAMSPVPACYAEWWSLRRVSMVLFAEALRLTVIGGMPSDGESYRVTASQRANDVSGWLHQQAEKLEVSCE